MLLVGTLSAPHHSYALVTNSQATKEKKQEEGEREFAGIHFGVGITLTLRSVPEIREADVVAGIVRVTKEQTSIPRVMLETHFFYVPQRSFLRVVDVGRWGWGPFLGIQNGEEEIINAVAAGAMIGFKRKADPEDKSSWNFGFGLVWDPQVKELGDGIEENQPLPPGETDVRFKEKSERGYVLVWSFSF